MLVLGQREGKVIYIGKDIQVKLIKLDPTVSQIGIEALKEILILRKEIAGFDDQLKNVRDKP